MNYPIQLILSIILGLLMFYYTWQTSKVSDNVLVLQQAVNEGDNSVEMCMILDNECRELIRRIVFLVLGCIVLPMGVFF